MIEGEMRVDKRKNKKGAHIMKSNHHEMSQKCDQKVLSYPYHLLRMSPILHDATLTCAHSLRPRLISFVGPKS